VKVNLRKKINGWTKDREQLHLVSSTDTEFVWTNEDTIFQFRGEHRRRLDSMEVLGVVGGLAFVLWIPVGQRGYELLKLAMCGFILLLFLRQIYFRLHLTLLIVQLTRD
jgi:hypothetical protein